MMTTIDSAGRVVIPKAMRQQLGLHGGLEVEIDLVANHIEIRAKGIELNVDQLADGPVLRPASPVPVLTVADVRQLLDEERQG